MGKLLFDLKRHIEMLKAKEQNLYRESREKKIEADCVMAVRRDLENLHDQYERVNDNKEG